jgi:hypothetical protein
MTAKEERQLYFKRVEDAQEMLMNTLEEASMLGYDFSFKDGLLIVTGQSHSSWSDNETWNIDIRDVSKTLNQFEHLAETIEYFNRLRSETERKNQLRQQALAKLSTEEKEILGID